MFTETLFEVVTPNTTAEDFAMLKEAQIFALHYHNEKCDKYQHKNEAPDSDDWILVCEFLGPREDDYYWQRTNRKWSGGS